MAYDIASNPDLYNQVIQHYKTDTIVPWAWNPNQQNINAYTGQVNQNINSFASQFENFVGRAPTAEEINKFVGQFIIPNTNNMSSGPTTAFNLNPSSYIQQFLGENYQNAANDYATQQLTAQQGEANRLADLFRSQGQQAINDTEQSLLDYQQKLFERIRPNLITSLQAQGLLNTGGMNEALAGQQGDLAREGANYISQLKLQNDQAANQIAFSGASAPYQFQQNQIMQQPDYLRQMGQLGLQNTTNNANANMNYQYQLGLINAQKKAQEDLQPSFMRTMGQGFANSLGSGFSNLIGNTGYSNGNQKYSGMATLFA